MLQLVYGRAGSGKTEYLMQSLCQKAAEGKRVMLLVPEQASFEAEKAVFRRLGGRGMMNVEVLSFTRLADYIFRSLGGGSAERLDEPTRLMLLSAALDEVLPDLDYYSKSARGPAFLQMLAQAITLFKFSGLSPQQVQETAQQMTLGQDSQLGKKLQELGLVYAAFQAMVERCYEDPQDDLQRACRLAAHNAFFEGWNIYIDDFMSFTAAQLDMLKIAVEDSESMTAAFCGLPGDTGNQNSLFYSSLKSAQMLEKAAKTAFVELAEPVLLQKGLRYQTVGAAAAEALLCGAPVGGEGCEGLKVIACRQHYDEVEYTACRISSLVREQGLRYRDIAVICRNMEQYRATVETVFQRYGIPVFVDRVTSLRSHPLVLALLSALEAVRGSWDTEQLISLAKTPAFGLGVEEAAKLENYCYIWSLDGKAWEEDFTANPHGLQRSKNEQDEDLLAELNAIRRRIVEPLLPLRQLARGCSGVDFATGCYEFLQKVGCAENMRNFCLSLAQEEQKSALEQTEAVWEKLMELLNAFALAWGQVRYPLGRFADLLTVGVDIVEVGQIPTTLDQVSFGSADRVRPNGPKAVFLLGANEGVFPPAVSRGGIFSEKEYHLLAGSGIELAQPVFQLVQEERFYFYRAASSASHMLFVLYACSQPTGGELQPCPQVEQLTEAFPDCVSSDQTGVEERVVNLATAQEELARNFAPENVVTASLAQYLGENGQQEVVDRLAAAEDPRPSGNIDPQSAAALFRKEMTLSASRVESFYNCAFKYFCKYGLRIEPLRRAEFSPLESGSAIHYVLEQMVERHGGQPLAELSAQTLHAEVVELMNGYLEGLMDDPLVLGARKLYLFNRMVSVIVRVLQRLGGEFAQSVFQPVGVEVAVGEDGPILPLRAEGEDGIKVSIKGSI
ncbi:MAG: exodeoxyribonuclease V subunit gamma, partial [Oscillospiraceae bacterium]|nr:exodeoxyribonuclease V subunit gamma [Oscillospiraceae bacterium]